ALGHPDDDYTSYVRGVEISYAPGGPEEFCSIRQRRATAYTDVEYDQMLYELAMPGKDWRYDS
ncbi:hypothetical protein A2U01_0053866, partial [Trifolium medium]|nr:hypothetical protein [Trifolium medium]